MRCLGCCYAKNILDMCAEDEALEAQAKRCFQTKRNFNRGGRNFNSARKALQNPSNECEMSRYKHGVGWCGVGDNSTENLGGGS